MKCSPINQERAKQFKKRHHPNAHDDEYHSLLLCSSTDESGWGNDTVKTRGIGLVRQNPPVKESEKSLVVRIAQIHQESIKILKSIQMLRSISLLQFVGLEHIRSIF